MGATTKGSPPRVRGKGTSSASTTALFRITPAYAGKSNMIFLRQHVRKDHPRVCGEKHPSTAIRQRNTGSPSRMRGKAVHHKHRHSPGRITPACAGKSLARSCLPGCLRDHPRVCGEKLFQSPLLRLPLGSPPRVRGKVLGAGEGRDGVGITPACAGKREDGNMTPIISWDHPRVCGEKFHPASDRKLGRVRGTKRSSGLSPAAAPAGLAGSCPASPPWSYPPRITVSRPRP